MSFLSGAIHAIGDVAAPVLKGVGAVMPGSEGNRLTSISDAISNPNVTYNGALNPLSITNQNGADWSTKPTSSPVQDNSSAPTYQGGSGGNTVSGGNSTAGGSGSSSSSSGGAGTSNPTYSSFQNYLGQLQSAYGSLFGNGGLYDQQTQSRENADQSNYGSQKDALNQQYAQNSQQLPEIYGARGIGDSSYAADALGYAKNTYGDNFSQIGNAETSDLSALQAADQQAKGQGMSQLKAYQDLVNNGTLASMPNYEQAEQLSNLMNSNVSAQGQLGGTGSNASFLSSIASPVQNQGTSQLQSQLSALSSSPTTSAAQNQIAAGLIGSSSLTPQQQAQGQSYWNQVSNAV